MRPRWRLVLAAWVWCACARGQPSPPHCPSDAKLRCTQGESGTGEYSYTIDGVSLTIEYTDSHYFLLKCSGNVTLDNSALPRFKEQLRVEKVRLARCPAPNGSYADVLKRLNVLMLDKLTLNGPVRIARAQLAGLARLPTLMLYDAQLEPDALDELPALRRLHLDSLRLPPGALARLPPALQVLELVRTGAALSAALLGRLPNLTDVLLRDSERAALEPAGRLQKIALEAPVAHVPAALLPTLRELVVNGWDEPEPLPWSACDMLESLLTYNASAVALPADWLGACPRLRVLRLERAPALARLHQHALRNTPALEELVLTGSALRELPAGLLDDARKLLRLDLSGNHLHVLPSGLFASTKLILLNLSSNNFTNELFASLEAVTSLNVLILKHNVNLMDSCRGGGAVRESSSLRNLRNLTELSLRNTSAEVICRDWAENMLHLKELDLAFNKITTITYVDLQFRSTAEVNLLGNNVTRLLYTDLDYKLVLDGLSLARANVRMRAALRCDCTAYWAARALRERPGHVRLGGAQCAGAGPLAGADLDALLCAAQELCRPAPGCACAVRPQPAPPGRVLRVSCEHAGLSRPPRLDLPGYALVLKLAHNHIADFGLDDLPKQLLELDLRYNNISRIDDDVASALLTGERSLLLSHNPLDCSCSSSAALAALRMRRSAVRDYDNATCSDGFRLQPLARASPGPCPAPRVALLVGLALLALLAGAALLALLAHPALRLRLRFKVALHACGWLPGDERDDGRRFDAFVSFSHGDERFVREQLVARLESGPAPYRLCVHYRDWAPGGWIPAQIAASVRASRRTLAVVSEHFLASAWARAELREAYALALRDQEPRLVVVLLDEPERLPLDDKLRRYLANNTYVRWGDPWFWQKLRLALPRSRGRAAGPGQAEPGQAGAGQAEPGQAEPGLAGAGLELRHLAGGAADGGEPEAADRERAAIPHREPIINES